MRKMLFLLLSGAIFGACSSDKDREMCIRDRYRTLRGPPHVFSGDGRRPLQVNRRAQGRFCLLYTSIHSTLKKLKLMTYTAYKNGWIAVDPFAGFYVKAESVSYTHLDVYKRQAQRSSYR